MFGTICKTVMVSVFVILGMTGCAPYYDNSSYSNNEQVKKEHYRVQRAKQDLQVANDMRRNVTTQNTLEGTISSLAAQMLQNKKMSTRKPVLVTSFVRLNQLKKTTEFGRVISESLINELSNRGFNIIEYRGQMAVSINDEGEYFITRKPHKLKDKVPSTYVVVGTYSRQMGRIILNARVIDNITGKIITSARSTYKHNYKNDCILFRDCKPTRTIRIVKER